MFFFFIIFHFKKLFTSSTFESKNKQESFKKLVNISGPNCEFLSWAMQNSVVCPLRHINCYNTSVRIVITLLSKYAFCHIRE